MSKETRCPEKYVPDITCQTCNLWDRIDKGCPIEHPGASFSCSKHQNFAVFTEMAIKAMVLNNQARIESGHCHGCQTTIWSDEAFVKKGEYLYHLTCLITQRAQMAESEVKRLTSVNKTLGRLIKSR